MNNEQVNSTEADVTVYPIGSVSLAQDGTWYCHYVGFDKRPDGTAFFGEVVLKDSNVRRLMDKMASRINHKKDYYLDIIERSIAKATETPNEKSSEPSSDGLRDGVDLGESVD